MQKNSLISRAKVVLHFHEAPLVPIHTFVEYYVIRHRLSGKFLQYSPAVNSHVFDLFPFSDNILHITNIDVAMYIMQNNQPKHNFKAEELEVIKVRETKEVIFIKEMI